MTLNGNLPLGGLDRIIEVAEHAFGQYITNGPSVPPESMNVPGLEGVRSRLARSPCADHHEAAGWVAVEQAFAIAGSPKLSSRYPIAPLFDAANESFTVALGRHDETVDQPRQLLEIKLAMAALAIYAPWAAGEGISGKTASTFHEEAAEV